MRIIKVVLEVLKNGTGSILRPKLNFIEGSRTTITTAENTSLNSADITIDADDSGVIENFTCDASVAIGSVVRISSGVAVNAQADSLANSHFVGIAEAKPSSVLCNIRVSGISPSIYAGLNEGSTYFLDPSTPGALTTTPPTGSNEVVVRVGQPVSPTRLALSKGLPLVRS